MRLSKVFLNAAKICAKVKLDGACLAIVSTKDCMSDQDDALDYFAELFRQGGFSSYYFKYEDGHYNSAVIGAAEAQKRRVIALLLASEIAKSEGL